VKNDRRSDQKRSATPATPASRGHRSIIELVLELPGPLVDLAWLRAHLDDPQLRIVDVRWALSGPPGRELYAAGHIPGAAFLDADRELSSPGEGPGRHPIPSSEKLSAVLGRAGIGDDHVVVAYDEGGGSIAARLWWLYRHFGHEGRCAILDGGLKAWTDAGLPLVTEPPDHLRATWTPGPARDDVVGTDEVERLIAGGGTLLLDARAAERYRGETEPIDPRAGHVPGAINAPWSGNVGEDGRFLPVDALRRRYAALGAGRRPVVAYCGSSLSATHDLLALSLAGIDGRLYEGSWSDWSSDPERPIAVGEEP
jgi:thiosulfate/3-mercaptopyruvate sulfurtransferase